MGPCLENGCGFERVKRTFFKGDPVCKTDAIFKGGKEHFVQGDPAWKTIIILKGKNIFLKGTMRENRCNF